LLASLLKKIIKMIIGLGLIFDLYLVQLLISEKVRKNLILSRIAISILIVSSLFTLDWLYLIGLEGKLHLIWSSSYAPSLTIFDGLFRISSEILSFELLITFFAGLILSVLSLGFNMKSETYLIVLTNILGSILLLYSYDWIMTILSWELFNLSLYLLVSINYGGSESSLSAALKYFLLSALSTGLLFLGIFFIYMVTGSTQYDAINLVLVYDNMNPYLNIGFALILGSILFKLAAAPLHSWAPDLYDAIPTNLTMYMMIIPKISVLFLLGTLVQMGIFDSQLINSPESYSILSCTAILSILIGSIGLISQLRIKRFLAYSGISHLGFILIAIYCNDQSAYLIYTLVYAASSVLIFLILISLSGYKGNRDLQFIPELAGLFRLNPLLSLAFSLAILSLAGCPPLLGFFSKLFVLNSLISFNLWPFAIIAILCSTISCARYLYFIRYSQFTLSSTNPNSVQGARIADTSTSYIISTLSILLLFAMLNASAFPILTLLII
jgi:NADH-ubiquinone oxidoreductase chain 2